MAEDLVTDARIEAGREYVEALEQLGFKPEGAMWSMRENEPDTLELSLFSSVVDRVGPRAVYDALFTAYDKSLTPKDFDPWEVAVYSPGTHFYECFSGVERPPGEPSRGVFKMGAQTTHRDERGRVIEQFTDQATRVTYWRWIYTYPESKKQSAVPQLRSWHRFEERIAKAA